MDETSQPIEMLLSITRDGRRTLGTQIEAQLRSAIREGRLRAGVRVPSTRDLARQLGVSRRVVVGAYAQLAAEGYLTLRQGARPYVAETTQVRPSSSPMATVSAETRRFDLRPRAPDVSSFPRSQWLRCLRDALQSLTNAELGYGDPQASRRCGRPFPSTSAGCAA